MFTNLRPLFATAALLTCSTLAAQTSRYGSHFASIGNSWLGGTVFTSASLSTSVSGRGGPTTRSGNAAFYAGVDGKVLTFTLHAAQLDLAARNTVVTSTVTPPTQNATASLRLQLAGFNVWDRSVTTTGDLGGIPQRTYNLFGSSGVSAPVSVGPFTIELGGNAGVTLGAGAVVILPTTAPEVRFLLSANTAVLASCHVKAGAIGFYAGVELQGRFAEQRVTVGLTANAITGFSGSCYYEIQAMSLRLIAFLEAFWHRVYSTTLASWASGFVGRPEHRRADPPGAPGLGAALCPDLHGYRRGIARR